ncbi:hypothetical protein PN36_34920 [Candidatus Thiomargarita nelsonii]|uniref:Uncharacterized protein n=1 Tax=Candidatus Thiomargarita nelsonii TaxID=1003181 RepID=A0A4E0QIR5_9GAMM|nr:hypothetical protein PN36_34920 [Candidatus Thiomargarita nelsonii]
MEKNILDGENDKATRSITIIRELLNDDSFKNEHRTASNFFSRKYKLDFVTVILLILQKSVKSLGCSHFTTTNQLIQYFDAKFIPYYEASVAWIVRQCGYKSNEYGGISARRVSKASSAWINVGCVLRTVLSRKNLH